MPDWIAVDPRSTASRPRLWNAIDTFHDREVVVHAGALWRALSVNTNITPVEGATWTVAGGATGPQGPAGPEGPQGDIGAQGVAGVDGTDGSLWWGDAGAPAGGLGIQGDWYLNTSNGDVYNKTGPSTWTLEGNIRGPTGLTGPEGPEGPEGAEGPPGTTTWAGITDKPTTLAGYGITDAASDAELAAHGGAADPHTGYQLESEKGAANGYASLGAGGLVPMAQIATGTPNGTKFVRDDGTLAAPPGGGSFSISAADIDFGFQLAAGDPMERSRKINVVDAAVTASSKLMVLPAGVAPAGYPATSYDADEMDPAIYVAVPLVGSFDLITTCVERYGRLSGKRRIHYLRDG